jgi:hypothetical protein
VTTTTGDTYNYTLTFKKVVPESKIDSIISGGIKEVNDVIKNTAADHNPNSYAELGALDANNHVTVTISNGDAQVTSVYKDIVETLLGALNNNSKYVASIRTSNNAVLTVGNVKVQGTAIEAFVKASALRDNGSDVTGNTKLSALDKQKLTATVRTTCGEEYTYVVEFVLGS